MRSIKIIGKKYDIAFSYNPEAIEEIEVSPLAAKQLSIDDFLLTALYGSGYGFEVVGGVYVIIPLPETEAESAIGPKRRDFALSGIIHDRMSGEPLPYASVNVAGTSTSTIANSDGKFTLVKVPVDTVTIVVRYIGYKNLTIKLNTQLSRSYLYMEMMPQERLLPSIQITGEKEELIELQTDPGHISFNPTEITKLPLLGEADLFRALRWLPGIASSQTSSSGIKIRGSASDQNLILFDGITLYHIDHFFGFFSAFNSNVIKNVQVYKGSFGAQFGGRTAGVVDIAAIEGNNKDATALVELNTMSISALLELPLVENKASLVVAFRRGFTDILQSTTYKNIFNNIYDSDAPGNTQGTSNVFDSEQIPDYFYYDFNAKFTFKPTIRDAISIGFYNGVDNLKMRFLTAPAEISRESIDNTDWGNTGGSFKWSRKWNKRFFTYANFSLSSYRSNLNAEESFYLDQSILLSRRFFEQRTHLNDYTIRLDNTYELNELTSLNFGYWYTDYRIVEQSEDQDFIFQDSTQKATLHAFYAQMNRQLGILKISGGVRISPYTGTSKVYIAPRLSLSAKILPYITLKTSLGEYHQMIRRLNERSLYFSVPESWGLAQKTALPVLESQQYSLGLTWEKRGWQFDAEVYLKTESGTVELLYPELVLSPGQLNEFAYDGDRRIRGFDLLLKKNFEKQNLLVSYTYTDARSKYDGINSGNYFRSSGYSLNEIGVVYNLNLKNWDFSAAITASSGLPYTEVLGISQNGPDSITVQVAEINSSETVLYHRVDISLGYTIPLKKSVFQLGISVYNIYNNQSARLIDYYLIPSANGEPPQLEKRDLPSLGFTPSAFLKIRI